jgi:hypothetical protein
MKIAIIGAGWVGCHLALSLKKDHEIKLYEKKEVFLESSSKNQNRLHLGYHYSRSYSTRNLCKITFDKFVKQYGHLIDDIQKNYYAISSDNSLLDFETYLKIYDDFQTHYSVENIFLKNITKLINVDEKYINPKKAKKYFEDILCDVIEYENIDNSKLEKIKFDYDLVVNCTNNNFCPIVDNVFSENCTTLIYKKIKNIEFGAITLVDGKLFSIYPYDIENDLFTLTDVEFTPNKNMSVGEKKIKMESKVLYYYETFLNNFEYYSYFESKKNKIKNLSDTRVPNIKRENNMINVFTGKIQGIYLIEDYIKKL